MWHATDGLPPPTHHWIFIDRRLWAILDWHVPVRRPLPWQRTSVSASARMLGVDQPVRPAGVQAGRQHPIGEPSAGQRHRSEPPAAAAARHTPGQSQNAAATDRQSRVRFAKARSLGPSKSSRSIAAPPPWRTSSTGCHGRIIPTRAAQTFHGLGLRRLVSAQRWRLSR